MTTQSDDETIRMMRAVEQYRLIGRPTVFAGVLSPGLFYKKRR